MRVGAVKPVAPGCIGVAHNIRACIPFDQICGGNHVNRRGDKGGGDLVYRAVVRTVRAHGNADIFHIFGGVIVISAGAIRVHDIAGGIVSGKVGAGGVHVD